MTTLTIKGVVIGDRQTLRAHYPVEVGFLKLKKYRRAVWRGDKGTHQDRLSRRIQPKQRHDTSVNIRPAPIYRGRHRAARRATWRTGHIHPVFRFIKSQGPMGTVDLAGHNKPRPAVVACQGGVARGHRQRGFLETHAPAARKAPKAAYSTSSIDLGRIQRGKVAHAELTVDNYGKSPLIIRRASCPEDFVKVKCGKEKNQSRLTG